MASSCGADGVASHVERCALLQDGEAVETAKRPTSSLLKLPRELRDQIYDYVLTIPDNRGERSLRIERRHLKHFTPTATTILLVLHHEPLLLNRQVALEALEVLLKRHTLFLSCGPFVLKTLLSRIEDEVPDGRGKQWLKWIKHIELEWATFPNLKMYPPNRENGKDEWWWENDGVEVDVDYVTGAHTSAHYDEYDAEGYGYDDNFYEAEDNSLYPSFFAYPNAAHPQAQSFAPAPADPFGFSTHYPFSDPSQAPGDDPETDPGTTVHDGIAAKLDLLVEMEVTPLFEYLASPTFTLSSITLPLYFVSRQRMYHRNFPLPLKLRYWIHVAVHALHMLHSPSSSSSLKLDEVRIKYMPWDIWATMDPSDDLHQMVDEDILFQDGEDDERHGQGEAFKAVWEGLAEKGVDVREGGLRADVRLVRWEGDLDKWRVGDELEVVLRRADAM